MRERNEFTQGEAVLNGDLDEAESKCGKFILPSTLSFVNLLHKQKSFKAYLNDVTMHSAGCGECE